ncbi:hypothetical protein HYW58_00270 [Candidatus Kaiserbacteria bacterium]|nr:hypothetical protein [Candidatus Kaiserbacteria bacterium]
MEGERKMKFNFSRSFVLGALIKNPDGSVTACPAFHPWRVTVPPEKVRQEVTQHLDDSSVIVVDLGPKNLLTDEIVVGGGDEENFRHISRNLHFTPFAGLL